MRRDRTVLGLLVGSLAGLGLLGDGAGQRTRLAELLASRGPPVFTAREVRLGGGRLALAGAAFAIWLQHAMRVSKDLGLK